MCCSLSLSPPSLFKPPPAMSFKDRTNEFHSMVDRIRSRSNASSTLERRSLLSSPRMTSNGKQKQHHPRSEFSLMAAEISRNITSTASKLEKLTKRKYGCFCLLQQDLTNCIYMYVVAKRKTLFDDKPVEISVCRRRLIAASWILNERYIGIDVYYQARYCQAQQANCHVARLYQAPTPILQASNRAYIECRCCPSEQVSRYVNEF